MKETNEKGITLIALVVTIVVLLILASVAISSITSDNGILAKVIEAGKAQDIANVKEKVNIDIADKYLENNGEGVSIEEKEAIIKKYGTLSDYTGMLKTKKGNEVNLFNVIYTDAFVTEWQIASGDVITLPIAYGYNGDNCFFVDWGDGSDTELISDATEVLTAKPTHTYATDGKYKISILGRCTYFQMGTVSDEERSKLISIASWGDTRATNFEFKNAINLAGEIPGSIWGTFAHVNSLNNLFDGCTKITKIPENLFMYAPNVENAVSVFEGCTGITSIPQGIFSGLANVKNFSQVFSKCSNIKDIPDNLFEKNTEVTKFDAAFYQCKKLETISDKLFMNNTKVTSFASTFAYCDVLEMPTTSIFDNNQEVTSFYKTFYDCYKLSIYPELWNRTTTGLVGTGCYHNCITAGKTIPAEWTQSA